MQNLPQKTNEQQFTDDVFKKALAAKIITPDSYAMENAIKSAWIEIASKGHDDSCNKISILNSVMDMIVQGLNPVKDQCYFVNYGGKLKLVRSYMGSIAVTKRFCTEVASVNAEIIYNGDELDFEIRSGVKFIGKHIQKFGNIKKDNIQGAYAVAVDHDGNQIAADIMTWDEILVSWERSQKRGDGQPIIKGELNPRSDHAKQPSRFCRRTVINRLCKQLISATDDKELLKTVRKTSDEDTPVDDYIDVVEEDITVEEPPAPQAIDFAHRQESQATKEQADKIVEIAREIGELDYMLTDISSFVQRDIKKLREISVSEADRYIEMKLKSIVQQPSKDDPSGDEPPPWKNENGHPMRPPQ